MIKFVAVTIADIFLNLFLSYQSVVFSSSLGLFISVDSSELFISITFLVDSSQLFISIAFLVDSSVSSSISGIRLFFITNNFIRT